MAMKHKRNDDAPLSNVKQAKHTSEQELFFGPNWKETLKKAIPHNFDIKYMALCLSEVLLTDKMFKLMQVIENSMVLHSEEKEFVPVDVVDKWLIKMYLFFRGNPFGMLSTFAKANITVYDFVCCTTLFIHKERPAIGATDNDTFIERLRQLKTIKDENIIME